MATFTGIKNILKEFYNRILSVISNKVGEEAKARRFATLSAVAGITNNNEINITVDDFTEDDLVPRLSLKLLVTDVLTIGSPTISINGTTAKEIKATRAGSKVSLTAHTGYWQGASSTSSRVWDAYTSLDLIYDGTDWVIIGNPVLCSYFATDKSYSVYSNGYIHQWGIQSGVKESVQTRTPLLIPYTQDFTIVDACSARTPYYSSYTADFTTLIFRISSTSGSEIIRWATFGY